MEVRPPDPIPEGPADVPLADAPGLAILDTARELDPEREEVFDRSYGPCRWNVGCG